MQTLQSLDEINHVEDEELRQLLQLRVQAFEDFDDVPLNELVTFVLVQAGDSIADLDAQLSFSVLKVPFDVMEEHAGYYEMTFVVSDDGYGIDVLVPKQTGVDPQLLSYCARHAALAKGAVDQ